VVRVRHRRTGGSLIPSNEAERLEAVRRYDILDTPPDGAFERITALAAKHFEVPIAIVSIVDSDRIWFKSHHGLEAEEIGRDPGLCASAILQHEPWVVEDAESDPRTMANPLVAGEMGLRFYAGAPLTTGDGYNLGTLCVIDSEPRDFSDAHAETLADMAAVVMDELELRLAARRAVGEQSSLREQAEEMARALQHSLLPPELPRFPGTDIEALYRPAEAGVVGGDFYDAFEVGGGLMLVVGDVSGKGAKAAAVTGLARHTIRTASLASSSPARTLRTLNQAMFLGSSGVDLEHYCTVAVVFACPGERGLTLKLASAGHPPAIVLRPGGLASECGASGLAAGWYRDTEFTEVEETLSPGDTLVLYTDGITEARTGDGGFLGQDGLIDHLSAVDPGSACEAVAAVRELILREDVDVRDDAATLVLRAV
jgi:phosphoserine phosphatase RsbU/P